MKRQMPALAMAAWILWTGLAGMTISCDSDSSDHPPPASRAWYYEHEFQNNRNLTAQPDQVVILDVLPGEQVSAHNAISYVYEEGGGHLFAIPSDDPYIDRAEILDASGVMVAEVARGDGGVYLDMAPGSYSVKVFHDGTKAPDQGTVAFIRRQPPGLASTWGPPAEFQETGAASPIAPVHPAYVALQFASGAQAGQYLAVEEGSIWDDGHSVDVRLLKAVPLDTRGTEFQTRSHLFSFQESDSGDCNFGSYPTFEGNYTFRSWPAEDAGQGFINEAYACTWAIGCPASQTKLPLSGWTSMPAFAPTAYPVAVSIQDDGNGTFTPWLYAMYSFPCSPAYAAENQYVYFTEFANSAAPQNFEINTGFVFYKDGSTQIDRRRLGKGQVALYEGENYTGAAVVLNSSFADSVLIPLAQVGSVAFGLYTDTTVRFFGDVNFSGEQKTVGVDTPATLDIAPGDMRSIEVFDSRKVLMSSKECPGCNLAGVDLSKLTLDAADLFNADLMNANLSSTSLQQANLSQALLSGARLIKANLSGASLADAFLNADSDLNLSAATLTGAYLKNVNCKGADLGGADFSQASFHTGAISYNGSGCAQDKDNLPFTKSCSSAAGANLDGTQLQSAYLAGTDFSGATAMGADFSGSVLTGALFKGTHLDWESGTGGSTDFTRAFLGGADFTDATAEGALFYSAYVNFSTDSDDQSVYYTIPALLTGFIGFDPDHQYGNTPCVWFAYSAATVVPQTGDGNVCPDGTNGKCDETAWSNPVTPRDQYQSPWQNSQGGTQPEWCLQVDYQW